MAEKLIVELDARTQKLDSKLDESSNKLNKLEGKTESADSKFKKFSASAKVAAASVTAVAVATSALITKTVAYAKELDKAAKRNNETVERTQSLAFAYNTVGVSLEKLGDIGKDTQEKIGEFLATGGGGFKDFTDVMGLTQEQAKAVAKEFEDMSGTDILQEMVKRMEEGGASAKEMSFALEGMASDTTDLIPLLTVGSIALNGLTEEFDALGVALTQEDINKISAVGIEFDKMTAKLGGSAKGALADYSGEITKAIRVTTGFLTTTGNVFNLIATGWGAILEVSKAAVTDLVNGTDTLGKTLNDRASLSREAIDKLKDDIVTGVDNINKEMPKIESPVFGGGDSQNGDLSQDEDETPTIKKINKEVEAIKDRFKTEQELLEEKFKKENELLDVEIENIKERDELKLELLREFEENSAAIKQEAREKEEAEKEKAAEKERKAAEKLEKDKKNQQKIDDKAAKDKAKKDEQLASNAIDLANFVFEDSKLISAGVAFVNTAEGVTKALAKQDYAGAAFTAAAGAAQISSILSASKGGGSVNSSGTSSVAAAEQDFDTTSQQEVSVTSVGEESSTQLQSLTFNAEGGSSADEFMAMAYNDALRDGRITASRT